MEEITIKGTGGQLTLKRRRVIISRKGILATAGHGASGNKEIPLKNITAVQFKEPSSITNGFIQFSILGGLEAKGGVFNAAGDENTVMFTKGQAHSFKEVKRFVDGFIDEEPIELTDLNIKVTPSKPNKLNDDMFSDVSAKSKSTATILSFFVGTLGIDRFYLGNTMLGIGKLLTLGAFGLWSLIDFIYIALGKAKDGDGLPVKN